MVIAPAQPSPKPKPRVIVYIDGLNLYYGVLQQVPAEKWLDVERLCTLLRPNDDVRLIKYFSAPVAGSADQAESALARMRSYEGRKITSPSRGFEV
jgi:hypothetical protein